MYSLGHDKWFTYMSNVSRRMNIYAKNSVIIIYFLRTVNCLGTDHNTHFLLCKSKNERMQEAHFPQTRSGLLLLWVLLYLYKCHRIITSGLLQTCPHTIFLSQEDKPHLSDLISLCTIDWQARQRRCCIVSHLVYSACKCNSTVFQITSELIRGMYEAYFVMTEQFEVGRLKLSMTRPVCTWYYHPSQVFHYGKLFLFISHILPTMFNTLVLAQWMSDTCVGKLLINNTFAFALRMQCRNMRFCLPPNMVWVIRSQSILDPV